MSVFPNPQIGVLWSARHALPYIKDSAAEHRLRLCVRMNSSPQSALLLTFLLLQCSSSFSLVADASNDEGWPRATTRVGYRVQQPVCMGAYFTALFRVTQTNGDAANGMRTYCSEDSDGVPDKYAAAHVGVQASAKYSLWAEIDPSVVILPTHLPACAQRPRSELCGNIGETPLYITNTMFSKFECRCRDGFSRTGLRGSCEACGSGVFCPMHTNTQFTCPANSRPAVDPGSQVPMSTSIQRLQHINTSNAYCVAEPGYTLQHAYPDFSGLLLAIRNSQVHQKVEFYTTSPCRDLLCFSRIICDAVGKEMSFGTPCPAGQYDAQAEAEEEVVLGARDCRVCPADSFCVDGTRHPCPHGQYTTSSTSTSSSSTGGMQGACKCHAGAYSSHQSSSNSPTTCVAISGNAHYS